MSSYVSIHFHMCIYIIYVYIYIYLFIYLFLFIQLFMYSCLSSWGWAATCFWRRMQRLRLRQFDTSNFKAPWNGNPLGSPSTSDNFPKGHPSRIPLNHIQRQRQLEFFQSTSGLAAQQVVCLKHVGFSICYARPFAWVFACSRVPQNHSLPFCF